MPNVLKADILKEELLNYFYDKRFDISQIVDFIYETIEKSVECDFEKLACVLNMLTSLKSEKSDLKGKNNFSAAQKKMYDISSETEVVFVKEILNETNPILFFYKDKDPLPFLKIITSMQDGKRKFCIEHSNYPELLTTKRDVCNEFGFKYIFKDIYLCNDLGNVEAKKYTYAKSGNELNEDNENYFDYKDIEFCKFTSFFKKLLSKYTKYPENSFSNQQIDLLESFFYNVESNMNMDMEFGFNDLLGIIDSLLLSNNKENSDNNLNVNTLTSAAANIASKKNDEIDFDITSYSNSGEPLLLSCSKNNQYLSIKITNSNLNKCTYLIYETTNGFTIFRNIEGKSQDKNILSSYTLNMSNNIFKFSAIGNSENLPNILTPVDVQLIIKEDGTFGFYCENIAQFNKEVEVLEQSRLYN